MTGNTTRTIFKTEILAFTHLVFTNPFRANDSPPTDRPNVILNVTDDQGCGDNMPCHGNPFVKTPHLDQLAALGARLENYQVDPRLHQGRFRCAGRAGQSGRPGGVSCFGC